MHRRRFLTACAVTLAAAPLVRAEELVIRMIVAFAPGGSGDLIPRIVAPTMADRLKETIVVENKSGAGGSIGASYVAHAAPDGRTIGVATVSTHAIQPAVATNLPYDPMKDFIAISNLARVPNVMAVNPQVAAANVDELVKLSKKTSGGLAYASPGVGSLGHMMGELFAQSTGAALRHVPYRGGGPAVQDVIAGHVQILFDNLPSSVPHISGGRLRALAVAWPGRVSVVPDVPTFAEVHVPALNDPAWFGLVAPAGTPQAMVDRMQQAVAAAMKDPNVVRRIKELGAVPVGNTSAEYTAEIKAEYEKWRKVAKAANISLEV